ncbi:MAG: AarF/ABC1/UbiB kinase family protein [Pseudomonadota bacterium]|mgnify:CR=1 FL=1
MTDKPTDAPRPTTQRLLKLAGMTARISGHAARDRWQRLWQSSETDRSAQEAELYTRIGTEIAETLGEMKGAVMKVGQVVSQYRDLLPPELVNALTRLQNDAPPQPFSALLPRLHEAFGPDLDRHFSFIDPTPLASASLAQVHRARTSDGREVVLKVQYPGVDAAVAADLKQLRIALKLARVLPVKNEILDALFREIAQSLEAELDYRFEAEAIARFRRYHADTPNIVIPEVLTALSNTRVLTLSFEPGDGLGQLDDRYDQPLRNQIAATLFQALGRQLYQFGEIHCDPHPGNFAARLDGSLVMYDFGCIKKVSAQVSQRYGEITRAALAGDAAIIESGLIALGARQTAHTPTLPESFYTPWLELAQESFSDDTTDFASFPMAERVITLSRAALPHWRAFQPVPETVMINRALGGHYWNLRQLGAQLALRPLLHTVLPAA